MTLTEITIAATEMSDRVRRNVKSLMQITGMSQQRLAAGIGISRPTIQKRVTDGKWKADEIGRLAAFFAVPATLFYEDSDELLRTLSDLGFRPFSCSGVSAGQTFFLLAS